jgi:hypothetical protein
MEQSPSWEAASFQLVKKFPAFYGTRRFITAFTSPRHLSLSWVSSIQSINTSHFLKIHLNITLPFTPGSPKWSLSLRFPHKNPVYASPLPHTRYMPRPSHSSRFYHPNNIGWKVQNNFLYRTRIQKFMKSCKRAVHKRSSLSHRKQRPKRHVKKQPLRTSSGDRNSS